MSRERSTTMDFAKGLAILLMIHDHVQPLGLVITSFHMPLFFFVSGWFYCPTSLPRLAGKRAKGLLLPYLCYYVAFILVQGLELVFCPGMLGLEETFPRGMASEELLAFFFRAVGDMLVANNCGLLWFLPCLFLVCILYALLDRLPTPAKWVSICFCNLVGYLFRNSGGTEWWYADVALVSLVFYGVGYEGRKLLERQRVRKEASLDGVEGKRTVGIIILIVGALILWILAIRGGALSLALRIYNAYPLCIIGAIAGTVCVILVSHFLKYIPLLGTLVEYCGRNTLKILCLSNIIQKCMDWNELFHGWPLSCRFLLQVVVILPIVGAWDAVKKRKESL